VNDAMTEPELRLSLAATPANVAVARQAVTGLCEAVGVGGRALGDVRLGVTEACTNVVVHAYPEEAVERPLELDAHVGEDELEVVVRDRGRGMGVFTNSAGLGLGLPLIAALTARMEVRASADGDGTEVAMAFALKRRDDG
jgi:anti-sigma regulatory factor (Ser/Thr protein kinase)